MWDSTRTIKIDASFLSVFLFGCTGVRVDERTRDGGPRFGVGRNPGEEGVRFIVHVGGTRGVTWSIDRSIQRHARITWGVELILAMFFIFFLYVLTDMTTTLVFFQWLTLSDTWKWWT